MPRESGAGPGPAEESVRARAWGTGRTLFEAFHDEREESLSTGGFRVVQAAAQEYEYSSYARVGYPCLTRDRWRVRCGNAATTNSLGDRPVGGSVRCGESGSRAGENARRCFLGRQQESGALGWLDPILSFVVDTFARLVFLLFFC